MKSFLWKNDGKGRKSENTFISQSMNDFHHPLSKNVKKNEQLLKDAFENCSDIIFRTIPVDSERTILFVYVDGLVDTKVLNEAVLKPWTNYCVPGELGKLNAVDQFIEEQLIAIGQTKIVNKISDLIKSVLKGNIAVLVEGKNTALLANAAGFEKRTIDEPKNETVISGPRDSFTENLRTNTMLLRRRIASPYLKMESFTIGELTHTDVVLTYIKGLADDSLLDEVRRRLRKVNLKSIMDSGYIEEFIQDTPLSPFPQLLKSERPDTTAASLIEGKISILVDCTPIVLILPVTFWTGLQSADDHYERFVFVVVRRSLRYIMTVLSLILPATYVALTTFNPDMLPGSLYQSVAAARELSPFPTVIETAIMGFIFEGLQEAGLRVPGQLGPIVSIVGALIVGEAAVKADLVSVPIIVVIALTGIASYTIPHIGFSIPFRLLRFGLLLLAGIFGIYGLSVGCIAVLIHLMTLESFGVPYMSPIAPLVHQQLKDVLIRTPRWSRKSRQ